MTVVLRSRGGRGVALLASHFRSLDPDAPSARERLAAAIGVEFADTLVCALCNSSPTRRRRFAA